jgi:hypothetical protein
MPGTTPVLALPYPTPDDNVDVPRDVKALADKLDASFSGKAARVYHSTALGIANNTPTPITTFDSERFDTDNIHDPVTNSGRLTCRTAGKYLISASIVWDTNPNGHRQLNITFNGVTNIAQDYRPAIGYTSQTITTIWNLAVNDWVELRAQQTSGGGLNILADPAQSPEFMMVRIA